MTKDFVVVSPLIICKISSSQYYMGFTSKPAEQSPLLFAVQNFYCSCPHGYRKCFKVFYTMGSYFHIPGIPLAGSCRKHGNISIFGPGQILNQTCIYIRQFLIAIDLDHFFMFKRHLQQSSSCFRLFSQLIIRQSSLLVRFCTLAKTHCADPLVPKTIDNKTSECGLSSLSQYVLLTLIQQTFTSYDTAKCAQSVAQEFPLPG